MAVRAALLLLTGLCLAAAPAPAPGAGPHVVLPVQLAAEGELNAARRLAEQDRWDLALPMLQALLEGSPQALVHSDGLYRPLGRVVNDLLSDCPPEALRNYALLYGPAARKLYERGVRERSAALLREASVRYLHTPSGVRAAGALAGILMDEGRFASALLVLSDTDALSLTAAEQAPIAARRIICLARLGRRGEADGVVAALKAAGVGSLSVDGKSWEPAAFADRAFAALAPAPSEVAPPPEPDVAAAVTLDLPGPAPADSVVPAPPSTRAIAAGDGFCVVRNAVTYCLKARPPAVAWSAQAPGWVLMAAAVGDDQEPLTPYFIPSASLSQWMTYDNRGLSTLSAGDGRLYAVQFDPASLGFPETPWEATPDDLRLTNQLSCLDPADGRLLWSLGGGLPITGAGPHDYWFFTAPTVSGDRLYVLAALRGNLLALCLEARTGRIVWQSPVGPLESRQEIERYWPELFLSDACPPAVADGIAVFPTGQGVVCGFDTCDGSLRWASPYPRAEALISKLGQRINVPSGSWMPRRPLIDGDLCLLAPADSRSLVALSPRTGRPRWQKDVGGGLGLLGAAGGRAYVQTRAALLCLDLATGADVWRCGLPPAPGLGALGRSAVYVPQADGLLPVDAATGRPRPLLRWPEGSRTFGNLSFCGGSLVAAAPGRVTVCPPAGQGGAHSAPDDRATRQDRALALLRAALDDPQHADPVATYLDLCRGHGAELRPGTLAHASFWTALAAVVRERCAQEPALRRAFDAADLGRWSPFPRPAPPPPPSAPALDGTPTGREAWSVDGYAVLPAGREGADDPLLVVQKGKLLRVDPADGRVLWSTDLPEQTRPAGWNPAISLPPRQHSSIGMPAYVSTPGGVMVALPSGFLSVDPADGALRWARDAGWHWAQPPVTVRVPRQELVQRVRHGLPIPPGPGDRLQLLDGFAASSSVAARLLAGRGLQAVDPAGGTPLLDVQGESRAEFTGARVAAVGTGLAALLQQPERLLYYDLRGEDPLAEWRFRSAGFVRSMLAGPDEVLYVADYDGVYRLDLARLSLTDRWFVEGGVDGLLSADERAAAAHHAGRPAARPERRGRVAAAGARRGRRDARLGRAFRGRVERPGGGRAARTAGPGPAEAVRRPGLRAAGPAHGRRRRAVAHGLAGRRPAGHDAAAPRGRALPAAVHAARAGAPGRRRSGHGPAGVLRGAQGQQRARPGGPAGAGWPRAPGLRREAGGARDGGRCRMRAPVPLHPAEVAR